MGSVPEEDEEVSITTMKKAEEDGIHVREYRGVVLQGLASIPSFNLTLN